MMNSSTRLTPAEYRALRRLKEMLKPFQCTQEPLPRSKSSKSAHKSNPTNPK
jgi:hypothetical protein